MLAIVLALGTSVAYGTSNFLGPLLSRRDSVAAVLLVGQSAALLGSLLLVLGSGDPVPSAHAVLIGLLAGTANIVGLACFYRSAQLGPVSITAAVGALGTTLPVLYGLARGESLSAVQAFGIVVALGGAVLAAQRPMSGTGATPAHVGWALVSACGFGGLLIALPQAASAGGTVWALLVARIAVVVLLAVGVAVLRAPASFAPRAVPVLAVPGLLLLAGTLSYAEATARGQLSVISVLASLATVVTVALAFVVTGERLAPLQRAGVAAAAAGTVLLAL